MQPEDPSQRVEVRLLGPLEVARDGAPLRIGGPKRRALLARLALDPGGIVPADLLLHDLWAGRPPAGALATLQSHVAHLRRDLGPAGGAVVTASPGYSLQVDAVAVDALAFEREVQAARSLVEPQAVAARLDAALRLWRGRALVEFEDSAWAEGARARFEELRIEAEERHAAARLAQGDHAALVARLEALTGAHPLHERFWLHLMEALWGCGRHAEALRAAQRFRAVLGEIGVSPSPDLDGLEGAILRHAPPPRAPSTPRPAHQPHPPRPPPQDQDAAPGFSFVGRDREREALEAELDLTENEGQRIVLLSGEAGVGKSRLVRSVAELAAGRGLVLEGRCDDGLAVPFQPVVEALASCVTHVDDQGTGAAAAFGRFPEELARVVPELHAVLPDLPPPAPADPDLAQYRFFRAVDDWLSAVARHRLVLLVVEDVHWASRPTLLLLRHLMRTTAKRSLLLVATYRDPEPWRAAGADGWLADVRRRPNAAHIGLAGLDGDAVEILVREARRADGAAAREGPDPLAQQVHHLTRGNALLVVELLRHLGDLGATGLREMPSATSLAGLGVPASVHLLVRDRIDRLGDDAAQTVQRAAVLGMDVDLGVLRASSGLDDETLAGVLDALVGAQFLEPAGASFTFRFRHALVRDAVLQDLSDLRLALLHRDAGYALEARHGGDLEQNLDRLAAHFRAAAPLEGASRAVEYGIRAGRRALAEGAPDESLAHFETILALIDRHHLDDATARCEVLLGLGEAQRRVDRLRHRATFLDAARLARELGDVDRLARAAKGISRGFLTIAEADDPERIELISSALAALGDSPSPQRALLLTSLAGEVRFAGDIDRSHALAEEAVQTARATGSAAIHIRTLATQWDILFHPRSLTARTAISAELAALAERSTDPTLRLRAALATFTGALERADRATAQRAVADLRELGHDRLPPTSAWMVPVAGATWELARGRLDQAEALALRARELGTVQEHLAAEVTFMAQLFQIRLHQGRLAEIDDAVRTAARLVPAARPAYAYLCLELGRRDEAAAEVSALLDPGPGLLPRDVGWALTVALLAETVAGLSDAGRAAALESALLPTPEQHLAHYVYFFGPVAHHLGILRAAQGDRAGAEKWLTRAERSAGAFGARAYQERAQRHLAALD